MHVDWVSTRWRHSMKIWILQKFFAYNGQYKWRNGKVQWNFCLSLHLKELQRLKNFFGLQFLQFWRWAKILLEFFYSLFLVPFVNEVKECVKMKIIFMVTSSLANWYFVMMTSLGKNSRLSKKFFLWLIALEKANDKILWKFYQSPKLKEPRCIEIFRQANILCMIFDCKWRVP